MPQLQSNSRGFRRRSRVFPDRCSTGKTVLSLCRRLKRPEARLWRYRCSSQHRVLRRCEFFILSTSNICCGARREPALGPRGPSNRVRTATSLYLRGDYPCFLLQILKRHTGRGLRSRAIDWVVSLIKRRQALSLAWSIDLFRNQLRRCKRFALRRSSLGEPRAGLLSLSPSHEIADIFYTPPPLSF